MNTWRQNRARTIQTAESRRPAFHYCVGSPSFFGGNYDQTLETMEGRHSDRHLLLCSAVFWPWHFAHCGDINGYQIMTHLCTMLISEENHERWFKYLRLTANSYFSSDPLWHRVEAAQLGWGDPLSSVGAFGLSWIFSIIFESKPLVEKACKSRENVCFPQRLNGVSSRRRLES